jgi:hypothetical protein
MDKLKPALIGGVIVGLLSAIPFVNYCCCIWAIGGGALASFLYIKSSPVPVKPGDGAIVGALAGLVGAIIYLIIGIPVALVYGAEAMEQAFRQSGVQLPVTGTVAVILGALLVALLLLVLAVVGGLIAVPLLEKRKNGAMPPPPPDSGTGPGPYAA